MAHLRMLRLAYLLLVWVAAAPAAVPVLSYTLGSSVTLSTGRPWVPLGTVGWAIRSDPRDGEQLHVLWHRRFGGVVRGNPRHPGAYTFAGTFDRVSGSNGCKKLFGPGNGPTGWVFDRDYAGGRPGCAICQQRQKRIPDAVSRRIPLAKSGHPKSRMCGFRRHDSILLLFGDRGGGSTDNGKTFQVVGQIMQPSRPLSVFTGGGQNMAVGYGSLIVAGANGNHLDNPPADPTSAYSTFSTRT